MHFISSCALINHADAWELILWNSCWNIKKHEKIQLSTWRAPFKPICLPSSVQVKMRTWRCVHPHVHENFINFLQTETIFRIYLFFCRKMFIESKNYFLEFLFVYFLYEIFSKICKYPFMKFSIFSHFLHTWDWSIWSELNAFR